MSKRKHKYESIFEIEARLKQEAKKLVKEHKDVKPIKYLLKWKQVIQ